MARIGETGSALIIANKRHILFSTPIDLFFHKKEENHTVNAWNKSKSNLLPPKIWQNYHDNYL
jgi:hypothetical protein